MNRKDDMAEREKAEEVRKVAMESLGTTKRRKEDEKENSVDCKQPQRRRSAGSETVAYLLEKGEKERQGRAEEIELRKAQLELEQKKHNDVLQVLQQQQQQQQQMQAFAMLFQQQQQAELFLKLFEKLEKKVIFLSFSADEELVIFKFFLTTIKNKILYCYVSAILLLSCCEIFLCLW